MTEGNEHRFERGVERSLCRRLQHLGCLTYKFVSPGVVGVPDRLFVLPGGATWFVEIKREGGKLSASQSLQLRRLETQGTHVAVVVGQTGADRFVRQIESALAAKGGDAL